MAFTESLSYFLQHCLLSGLYCTFDLVSIHRYAGCTVTPSDSDASLMCFLRIQFVPRHASQLHITQLSHGVCILTPTHIILIVLPNASDVYEYGQSSSITFPSRVVSMLVFQFKTGSEAQEEQKKTENKQLIELIGNPENDGKKTNTWTLPSFKQKRWKKTTNWFSLLDIEEHEYHNF